VLRVLGPLDFLYHRHSEGSEGSFSYFRGDEDISFARFFSFFPFSYRRRRRYLRRIETKDSCRPEMICSFFFSAPFPCFFPPLLRRKQGVCGRRVPPLPRFVRFLVPPPARLVPFPRLWGDARCLPQHLAHRSSWPSGTSGFSPRFRSDVFPEAEASPPIAPSSLPHLGGPCKGIALRYVPFSPLGPPLAPSSLASVVLLMVVIRDQFIPSCHAAAFFPCCPTRPAFVSIG